MANQSIASTQMQDYVPTIIAGQTLEKMRADAIFSKLAYVDYSNDLKNKGETVQIPKLSTFTAKKKIAHTPAELQDMNSDSVSVTLSNLYYTQFLLEDLTLTTTNQNLIARLSNSAGNALIEQIESDFIGLFDNAYVAGTGTITTSNSATSVTGVGTAFTALKIGYKIKTAAGEIREITGITDDTNLTVDSAFTAAESGVSFSFLQQSVYANGSIIDDASIVNARKILRSQKTSMSGLVLVSNLDDYASLLNNSTFKSADSVNATMLRDGAAGRMRGFDVFESNFMLKSYSPAFNPNAIGAAFRVLKTPAKDVVASGVINDTETGLALRYVVTYDQANMGYRVGLDILCGMSVIDPEQIVLISEAIA